MEAQLLKWEFLGMEDFASTSQLRNERGGLRNGTHVPKGCFTEGDRRLRYHFAAEGDFRSGCLGVAKLFRSQGPFSQRPFLGCEISQTMDFPCFGAPLDSQISSFNFFAIPPDFDHSKRLSYI